MSAHTPLRPLALAPLLALWPLAACEGPQRAASPALRVEPGSLVLALPEEGDYRAGEVTLINEGRAALLITDVALTEEDDSPELTLLDADDWRGVVTLRPGEGRALRVGWRVLDAQPDRARLTLKSNDGPRTVEVLTADPDPELLVQVDPSDEQGAASARATLREATPGGFQRATVTLLSVSGAPLTLTRLCWVGEDECAEGALGSFRLCEGAGATPDACAPPAPGAPLVVGAARVLSALFVAPEGPAVREVGRLRVLSDAANAPDFVVTLTGETCVRSGARPLCGACGDGAVDPAAGERCDDGNFDDGDDCDNRCQPTCAALGACAPLDSDGDGVPDAEDSCAFASNAQQGDCDADGRGDACDEDACAPPPPDRDGDGVPDAEDSCPDVPNPAQEDRDGDGVGDACDPMPAARNHALGPAGVVQAAGVVTGDRYRVRGAFTGGAHLSTGEVYLLRGAFRP